MSEKDSALFDKDGNPVEGGQANSPADSTTEVISALTEKLSNVEAQLNSLRSDKDKAVTTTNQRLSDFEKSQNELVTMQNYLAKYGSPEEAARAMALDALIQAPPKQEEEPQSNSQDQGSQDQGTVQDEDKNLVPLLLGDEADKDPAYVALVGTGMTPNDAAVQLATQRSNAENNADPNAASGIATGGVGGVGETQQSVLENEYSERLTKVKQGDWKAIGQLKDDMRKKGYEVY